MMFTAHSAHTFKQKKNENIIRRASIQSDALIPIGIILCMNAASAAVDATAVAIRGGA